MSGAIQTKKSKSGTSLPESKKESSFSYEELCRIIEVCQSSGVVEIVLPGLSLKFEQKNNNTGRYVPEPDHENNAKESHAQSELELKEEQVAHLMLEDPVEFERQIASGELSEDERAFESEE